MWKKSFLRVIICIIVICFFNINVEAKSFFNDLKDYSWAEEYIDDFAERGILNGVSANLFSPGTNVKREEFIKIIVELFGYDTTNVRSTFSDVNSSAWYYKYISAGTSAGIINGIGNNQFGTGQNITRQDICTILYRVLQDKGYELKENKTELLKFEDNSEIASYAYKAIESLYKAEVINGMDANHLSPRSYATRAQMVKMAYLCDKNKINKGDTTLENKEKIILKLNKNTLKIDVGKSEELRATVEPANEKINWKSSDDKIASVENGIVKGIKSGTVIITAELRDGECKAECKITVNQPASSSGGGGGGTSSKIDVTPTTIMATLKPTSGATPTLAVTPTPNLTPGSPSDTIIPTQSPVATPTQNSIATPTQMPTAIPTQNQTATPTQKPTATPTQKPTVTPTQKPTATPTQKPTATPTQKPTATPTQKPTATPTQKPTATPTQKPTATPTQKPTATPTKKPTPTPTNTPKKNRIHFIRLDDQADAILLESNGKYALVDTGHSTAVSTNNILTYLRNMNIKEIEFIILTHKHGDHTGGFKSIVTTGFKVKKIYMKKSPSINTNDEGVKSDISRTNSILSIAKKNKIDVEYPTENQVIKLNDMKLTFYNMYSRYGTKIKLGPNGKFDYKKAVYCDYESTNCTTSWQNDNSIVTLVECNGHKTLLTADLDNNSITNAILNKTGRDIDVFKVGHHGVGGFAGGNPPTRGGSYTIKLNSKYIVATNTAEHMQAKIDRGVKICIYSHLYSNGKKPTKKSILWSDEATVIFNYDGKSVSYIQVPVITLSEKSVTIKVGDSRTQIKATIKDNTNMRSQDKELVWKSSDSKIVKVGPNGGIKGISPGTATITCYPKTFENAKVKCKVTVK